MLQPIPSELYLGGVYLPPALIVALIGLASAWVVAKTLNRVRLARYFWNPPLTFLALWVLMCAVVGLLFLAP